MSYNKAGTSLPSDPNRPCLVFLITSEGLVANVVGIKFIGPHGGCQMLSPIDLSQTEWASSSFALSPIIAPRCHFIGTKGALPVDHTTMIKSVRAFKISNQFNFKYSKIVYLYLESQAPFIGIPSTVFTNENIISTKSI